MFWAAALFALLRPQIVPHYLRPPRRRAHLVAQTGQFTAGDVLENFAPTYKLAVASRGALLVVLASCYPKVHHAVRDGVIRLAYGDRYTTDSLPFPKLAALTALIVGASTLVGILCDKVEVVLAYKGAIFGTLMVYTFPALMHAALTMQRARGSTTMADPLVHAQYGVATLGKQPERAGAVIGATATPNAALFF